MGLPDTGPTLPMHVAAHRQPVRFGRYRVERTLGEGGMGTVYAAFDAELQRKVAVKVLRRTHDRNRRCDRAVREARAMALLSHPNIVVVHEVGTDPDHEFIVMELIDGTTLADWLATNPARDDVIEAFVEAGRGLGHAHAHGLVHRDRSEERRVG